MNRSELEFNILEKTVKDPTILPFKKEILVLIKKFGESGQSGGSAPYTAKAISHAIEKLCLQKPLTQITGIDDEWSNRQSNTDNGLDNTVMYQNKRMSSIFKNGRDGKPYYIDAIIFKSQNGSCFTSGGVKLKDGTIIGSRQYIRLPFTPKSFYIDVIETEWYKDDDGKLTKQQGGGWWTSIIKDESQLKEVFEYYDKFDK